MSAIVFKLRVLDRTGWIGLASRRRIGTAVYNSAYGLEIPDLIYRPSRAHLYGRSSISAERVLRTNRGSARQSGRLGQCKETLGISKRIVPSIHAVC
jgi:hypothetical protein